MPLAAYASWLDEGAGLLRLQAAWGDPQGLQALVRVSEQASVATHHEAQALGQRVADALRAAGARPPVAEA